jgi:hypothetical protein
MEEDSAVEDDEEEVGVGEKEVAVELEKPGNNTRYPTTPLITIMTIIARAKTAPADPRFNITLVRLV